LFSTYIGGTGEDAAYAMNIDASGYIFVAGETESSDYPITAGAYDRSFNGDDDAFISKFSEPLFPPSNLTAKSTSSRSIVLGWKDNSVNETGFKIERRQGGCSASGAWSQIATKPANTTTHTVSGLNPDTAYSYRVRAYDAGSNSAFTNCASTTTGKSGTPSSPIGLTATSASSTKVNLRWQDKSDDETGFKIYRKQGPGAWAELDRVAANMVSYSDETAENNRTSTAYQYYVKACNAKGCSPQTCTATVPFKPAQLTAAQGTAAGSINISWTDNSANEKGFVIYRKEGSCSGSGSWTLAATVGANRVSWTDTGLDPGSIYAYRVRAYCRTSLPYAYGYSSWSNCDDETAPD
jgi:titin